MGLTARYPNLVPCERDIGRAGELLLQSVCEGGTILLCGNGGSAADCEHIAGELLKGFCSLRPLCESDKAALARQGGGELADQLQYGIRTVALPSLISAGTAFCNDVDPAAVYAQLVYALGRPGDVLLCLSTSGNARNVCNAAVTARAKNMTVIGLTGRSGGALAPLCTVCIRVPEEETYRVQELHLPVYHALCMALEREMFGT